MKIISLTGNNMSKVFNWQKDCLQCPSRIDLLLSSPSSHFIIFANDTHILFSHKDSKQLEKNNQQWIKQNFLRLNKLFLNIDKTNFMTFKNKQSNKPDLSYKIEIDDNRIKYVKVTKFLGVLINKNLSWKAHTSHITIIVSKYNGIIRKVKPYLNQDSLLTLYNTLVLTEFFLLCTCMGRLK